MSELEPTRTCSNPTATERIRAMLDERGVEHGDVESAPYPPYNSTRRMTTFRANKCVWQYIEDEREGGDIELEGRYMSMSVTPEQAIAATLGSCNCPDNCTNGERTETCHDEGTFNSWGLFTCSNCSIVFPLDAVKGAPSIGRTLPIRYCPNCGRKVVDA